MSQQHPQPSTVPAGQQPPASSPNVQQQKQAAPAPAQAQPQAPAQAQAPPPSQQQQAAQQQAAAAAAAAAANLYGNGGGLFEPQGGIFDLVKRKLREAAGYRTPMDSTAMAALSRYGGGGPAGAMIPHPMMMMMPGAGATTVAGTNPMAHPGMMPPLSNNLLAAAGGGGEDMVQQQQQQQQQQALMMAMMMMAAAGGNGNMGNNSMVQPGNPFSAPQQGASNPMLLANNNIANTMNPAMLATMYQNLLLSAAAAPANNAMLPTTPAGGLMMGHNAQINPLALLQQSNAYANPLLQQQQQQQLYAPHTQPTMSGLNNAMTMYNQQMPLGANTAFNYMTRNQPMNMYGAGAAGGYVANPAVASAQPMGGYAYDQHYYPQQNSSYYYGYGTTPYASTRYYRDPYGSSYSDPYDARRTSYF